MARNRRSSSRSRPQRSAASNALRRAKRSATAILWDFWSLASIARLRIGARRAFPSDTHFGIARSTGTASQGAKQSWAAQAFESMFRQLRAPAAAAAYDPRDVTAPFRQHHHTSSMDGERAARPSSRSASLMLYEAIQGTRGMVLGLRGRPSTCHRAGGETSMALSR